MKKIDNLFWTIDYIVDHLQYILKFERQRFIDIIDRLSPETTKKTVKPPTFPGLFKKIENAQIVKDRLETKGYTKNGEWEGLSNDRSELLCAYYVLKPLLKPGLKVAPTVKIFYSEFGLSENHITDRMMTTEPFNNIRDEFEIVFSDLLESKIKK